MPIECQLNPISILHIEIISSICERERFEGKRRATKEGKNRAVTIHAASQLQI